MAAFHEQLDELYREENAFLMDNGNIQHFHVNDYGGGYMDFSDMRVLPIGAGHVDFESFFEKLGSYGYDGDYTVESTMLSKNGDVNFAVLNDCFEKIRALRDKHISV